MLLKLYANTSQLIGAVSYFVSGYGYRVARDMKAVTLILAATSPALGIGKNGSLPWKLKREMKFFRQVTHGSTVVMGRKTWDSILPKHRPLANRTNIVVSNNADAQYGDGVIAATSIEEALVKADASLPVFVIGGAQIYKASLKYATNILLTLIEDPKSTIDCDTFFELDKFNFRRQPEPLLRAFVGPTVELPANCDEHIDENGYKYSFTLWSNIRAAA